MPCIYGRSEKLTLRNYFNKENEFAIVLVDHRLPRVLHHVCLQPQVTTLFWRLQQVNPFNWELPPPPPTTGLLH